MDDGRRSDDLEQQTEDLERAGERRRRDLKEHGDKLAKDIEGTRRDWERKQDDNSVPGAVPDPEDR